MGRNFNIGEVECTSEEVSFCMYRVLEELGKMEDADYSCFVKVRSIAKAIKALEHIAENSSEEFLLAPFEFYTDSSATDTLNHIMKAKEYFTQALVEAVLNKRKKLIATYL